MVVTSIFGSSKAGFVVDNSLLAFFEYHRELLVLLFKCIEMKDKPIPNGACLVCNVILRILLKPTYSSKVKKNFSLEVPDYVIQNKVLVRGQAINPGPRVDHTYVDTATIFRFQQYEVSCTLGTQLFTAIPGHAVILEVLAGHKCISIQLVPKFRQLMHVFNTRR